MSDKSTISFTLNGEKETREVTIGQTLLKFIRNDLHLTGTKEGCEIGECGACTVLLNNKPVNSCLVLAVELDGKELLTIEGLSKKDKLDDLQQAFIENAAFQCGYCTPGMIMAGKALLTRKPNPNDDDINEALSGNLCRCGAYQEIREAIKASAKNLEERR
jgi:aerobic carbon-monoxide dehydrogenase small subunit